MNKGKFIWKVGIYIFISLLFFKFSSSACFGSYCELWETSGCGAICDNTCKAINKGGWFCAKKVQCTLTIGGNCWNVQYCAIGDCCGNGICESGIGEDSGSCSSDCCDADGSACSVDGDCCSGYCDNDGVGAAVDGWFFTLSGNYVAEVNDCEESANSA